jgi:DNA-binding transcriptional LysR family regulator
MLDLNDYFYFVQAVDRGGFTAAGRSLGIPKSTLSYRLQQLENELGVRLLNRTSRRFGRVLSLRGGDAAGSRTGGNRDTAAGP